MEELEKTGLSREDLLYEDGRVFTKIKKKKIFPNNNFIIIIY